MIRGKDKKIITTNNILSKTNDYTIYRYYLGRDFEINSKKLMNSPFRRDSIPSFGIVTSNEGVLLHRDFGDNSKKGNCIQFVMQLFDIDYLQALKKINKDLNLKLDSEENNIEEPVRFIKPIYEESKPSLIQFIPKNFTKEELEYWNEYKITEEELKINKVFSIKKLYLNKQLIPNYNKSLRFAYVYDNYVKIYQPESTLFKWISSVPLDYISGLEDIKNKVNNNNQDTKLIIIKSKKDEIVAKKFFKDVCSTQNESSAAINISNIHYFQSNYKEVFINYDSDDPGVKASKYFNQYGFKYFNTPKDLLEHNIKDLSDFIKYKGIDEVKEFLKSKNLI